MRAKLVSKFIAIASQCKELNNFNAVLVIVAALENTSIHRLYKTWEVPFSWVVTPQLVPKDSMTSLQDLKQLMTQDGNYKRFRKTLHSSTPPCLPYIGISLGETNLQGTYLTDLIFIEEGNADNIHGLVNLTKRKQIANVIREIQQYQQTPYYFEDVAVLQNWLKTCYKGLSDNDSYSLSLQVRGSTSRPHLQREPREQTK
jgi:son of sevenless